MLDDVNERYVSRAKAAALYGVVIVGSEEDDDLAIDAAALWRCGERGSAAASKRRKRLRRRAPAGAG